jgi:hypothetical protein
MNEQEFFDLALRVIAQQASEAERAELDAFLAKQPGFRAEFERLEADTRLAREVLPLVNATEATAPEMPAYVRERLQTKVRRTLERPQQAESSAGERERTLMWRWSWLLGLVGAVAAVVFVAIPVFRQGPAPVIQVAMLDTAGVSRGVEDKDLALLGQTWNKAKVDSFSTTEGARAWETNWPADRRGQVFKILYDRPAGELRVLGRWNGKPFSKIWVVEQDFATVLNDAKAFVQEQTRR